MMIQSCRTGNLSRGQIYRLIAYSRREAPLWGSLQDLFDEKGIRGIQGTEYAIPANVPFTIMSPEFRGPPSKPEPRIL